VNSKGSHNRLHATAAEDATAAGLVLVREGLEQRCGTQTETHKPWSASRFLALGVSRVRFVALVLGTYRMHSPPAWPAVLPPPQPQRLPPHLVQ